MRGCEQVMPLSRQRKDGCARGFILHEVGHIEGRGPSSLLGQRHLEGERDCLATTTVSATAVSLFFMGITTGELKTQVLTGRLDNYVKRTVKK